MTDEKTRRQREFLEGASGKLNAKQEAFCREYMIDLNGTQAYRRVYPKSSEAAARSSAADLLANPNIAVRIKEFMSERSKRTEITADYVLGVIRETVERCRQAEQVYEIIDGVKEPTGEWKFEHSGVLKGCELLGKHLKLFTEKVETKLEGEVEVKVSKVDLSERVKQLKGET